MHTIKKISIRDLFACDRVDEIFHEYAEEGRGHLAPTPKPNADMYFSLEDQGVLDCIAVYNDGQIVGFINAFTVMMPHYTELSTTIESIFILKNHRSFGTGKRLIKMAQELARERGSKMFFMTIPAGNCKLRRSMKFSGMEETNIVYTKGL